MAAEPEVIRSRWCQAAETALLPAAGSVQELERTRADVLHDRCTELYQVRGSAEGWLVLRLEGSLLDELELVIVLGAGHGTRAVIPLVKRYATRLGATIRTHITRAGLKRMYEAEGFHQAQIVMRWRPGDGQ
ncbi:MAG: hypothetical protein KA296_13740 [Marinobacter sp.]|nr:hypothetical protein [Marinobacter sp.]